jgi:Flp pilus assembly protein TadD
MSMSRANSLFGDGQEGKGSEGGARRRGIVIGGTILVAVSAGVVGFALLTVKPGEGVTPPPPVLPASLEGGTVAGGVPAVTGSFPGTERGNVPPGGASPADIGPGATPVGPPIPPAGETYYGAGERLYLEGDFSGAANFLAVEAGRHPDRFQPSYLLGLALRRDGRAEEAVAALENAARVDPSSVKARVNLARALCDAGRHEEALGVVIGVSEGEGAGVDAWNVRGRALLNLGRLDEAIGAFEAAIGIEPKSAWALNNLGYALIRSGRHAEAVEPLETAVGIRPETGLFHNNLGMAYERTGRYAEALASYRRAVELGGGDRAAANEERLSAATDLVGSRPAPDDASVAAGEELLDE